MSILDYSRIFLDDKVFDEHGRPHDWVIDSIVRKVEGVVGKEYREIYLLGSVASLNYRDDSDIDISVVIEDGVDIEPYKEEFWRINGELLEGTLHPLNYYSINESDINFDNFDGVYSLTEDKWVKNYSEHDFVDVNRARNEIKDVKSFVFGLDFLLDSLEFERKDIMSVRDALSKSEKQDDQARTDTYKKMYYYMLSQMKESIYRLWTTVETIKKDRKIEYLNHHGEAQYSTPNVLWKFLEKVGFPERAKAYLDVGEGLFGDGADVSEEEITDEEIEVGGEEIADVEFADGVELDVEEKNPEIEVDSFEEDVVE